MAGIGTVKPPPIIEPFADPASGGIGQLLNVFLNVLVVAGGIYALFNFILAGYAFMSAGDDPKKVQGAWAKIWQTALGLAFISGALVLAAIFGFIIFDDPQALISPTIPGL